MNNWPHILVNILRNLVYEVRSCVILSDHQYRYLSRDVIACSMTMSHATTMVSHLAFISISLISLMASDYDRIPQPSRCLRSVGGHTKENARKEQIFSSKYKWSKRISVSFIISQSEINRITTKLTHDKSIMNSSSGKCIHIFAISQLNKQKFKPTT